MINLSGVGVVDGDVTLLSPTSAHAKRGEVLVLRGANGSGKTTLLRVLAGSRKPTSGSAVVGERTINKRDAGFRRRVAAMIGLPPMASDLTVSDHVALVATTWYRDPLVAAESSRRTLSELGLESLATRFPHELSSGQTQLFGLALTLARPFDVLLIDEPEQRLDSDHLAVVVDVLKDRRDAGTTLVVATHNDGLASSLASTTLVLTQAA